MRRAVGFLLLPLPHRLVYGGIRLSAQQYLEPRLSSSMPEASAILRPVLD